MKKSRFTEQQMVTILREVDRTTVVEAAKKHKVSDTAIYAWRKHIDQMEAADVKRLKALEIARFSGAWRPPNALWLLTHENGADELTILPISKLGVDEVARFPRTA